MHNSETAAIDATFLKAQSSDGEWCAPTWIGNRKQKNLRGEKWMDSMNFMNET